MKGWIEVTISDSGKKAMIFVPYIAAFYPVREVAFNVAIHASAAKIYARETYEEVAAKIEEATKPSPCPMPFANDVWRLE